MTKEELEAYEAGKLAGIAQQTVIGLHDEVQMLKNGQMQIMEKIEVLENKIDNIDKWRWWLIGAATIITMIFGTIVTWLRGPTK